MVISSEIIEKIRNLADVVSVISEYLPDLKKSGKNYLALCPFHTEKHPSFSVSPEKNLFKCFGCGVGGDVIHFIMKIENLNFVEAVEKLAKKIGVEVVYDKKLALTKSLYEVLMFAANFYHKNLYSNQKALEFLKTRCVNSESQEKFLIGYASSDKKLLEDAKKKGYDENILEKVGLIKFSEYSQSFEDYFKNKIIFPIFDSNGRVCAFGSRVLDDSLPKFINSPETSVFSKRKNLYGFWQGRQAIQTKQKAIVVEGYIDVIIAHQYGFKEVVSSLGTSLTTEQSVLLSRFAKNVTLIFDPDQAGIDATLRAIESLLELNFEVSALSLPEGLDPDEFLIKFGNEKFLEVLNNSTDWLAFILNILKNKYSKDLSTASPRTKLEIISDINPYLNKITSEVVKNEYIKQLAKTLDVELNAVKLELESGSKQKKFFKPIQPKKKMKFEEEIIVIYLKNPSVFKTMPVGEFTFEDKKCKDVYDIMQKMNWGEGSFQPHNIIDKFLEMGLSSEYVNWLNDLIWQDIEFPNPQKIMKDILQKINKKIKKDELAKLHSKIVELSKNNKKISEQEFKQYQKLLREVKY